MDEAFDNLKQLGKNNLEGVIQWLKEAKIIDNKTVTEEQVRTTFENTTGEISLDQFKNALNTFAANNTSGVDQYIAKLSGTGDVVKQAFEKLKSDGKNNVENVIQWMKDSKIIDSAKESEEKARKLFSDVKDQQKVEFEKFSEAVAKMAAEKTHQFSQFTNMLATQGPRLMNAFGAASSAFKDALNKPDE